MVEVGNIRGNTDLNSASPYDMYHNEHNIVPGGPCSSQKVILENSHLKGWKPSGPGVGKSKPSYA